MWRCAFCILAVALNAPPAAAQSVPGRDLLEFPVGTIAEAPPLATIARSGIWNPASTLLGPDQRARIMAAALDGASQQGVTAQLVAFAVPVSEGRGALGLSVLRSSVADLVRTDSDPQSIGSDIPYSALLVSGSFARRIGRSVDAGAAVRFQRGELDVQSSNAVHLDWGVIVHSIGLRDLRLAASTFLLSTGFMGGVSSDVRLSVAGDLRILGSAEDMQLRGGSSAARTKSLSTDHYAFASARLQLLELNVGTLFTHAHGADLRRTRLGVGLRSANIAVGLAREENAPGIAPTYQVVVTSYVKR